MKPGRTRSKSKGQSLVELGLILPMVVMMLALSADFSRAFSAYIAISSGAREGAAYGMQSVQASQDTAGMRAAVLAESSTIWGVEPQVSFPGCSDGFSRPDGVGYDCVAVRVTYNFSPLITIGPIPNSIQMERTVEMRVVN
jgi:hypothetical protein